MFMFARLVQVSAGYYYFRFVVRVCMIIGYV
jgi:hypothetical protein